MFCDDDVLGLDMPCSKELFDTVALSVIVIVSKDLNVFLFPCLRKVSGSKSYSRFMRGGMTPTKDIKNRPLFHSISTCLAQCGITERAVRVVQRLGAGMSQICLRFGSGRNESSPSRGLI